MYAAHQKCLLHTRVRVLQPCSQRDDGEETHQGTNSDDAKWGKNEDLTCLFTLKQWSYVAQDIHRADKLTSRPLDMSAACQPGQHGLKPGKNLNSQGWQMRHRIPKDYVKNGTPSLAVAESGGCG